MYMQGEIALGMLDRVLACNLDVTDSSPAQVNLSWIDFPNQFPLSEVIFYKKTRVFSIYTNYVSILGL